MHSLTMRWLIFTVTILMAVGAALLGLMPISAQAHPGNTDSAGCHTCRTNCTERWGISYGYYHRHSPVRPCFTSVEPVGPIRPISPVFPSIPSRPPNQLPDVFINGTETVEEGQEARFWASADDPDGYVRQYRWTFGDGTRESGNADAVKHKFSSPGRYRVNVTAIDNDGGRSSATHYVDVEGKKWPLTRGLMTGIVMGSLAALWVIYLAVSAIIDSRRRRSEADT